MFIHSLPGNCRRYILSAKTHNYGSKNNSIRNQNSTLHCPVCQFEYTHLENVREYSGQDERKNVTLSFSCENGHKFSMNFHNQKGYTTVREEEDK